MVIDERYKTDKPQYDNTVMPQKSRETLQPVSIDWIWINQTWGGLKIGPNRAGFLAITTQQVLPYTGS
jgi:hypothetical protein